MTDDDLFGDDDLDDLLDEVQDHFDVVDQSRAPRVRVVFLRSPAGAEIDWADLRRVDENDPPLAVLLKAAQRVLLGDEEPFTGEELEHLLGATRAIMARAEREGL